MLIKVYGGFAQLKFALWGVCAIKVNAQWFHPCYVSPLESFEFYFPILLLQKHPMAFQVGYARTDIYKYSYFPTPLGIEMHSLQLQYPLLKVLTNLSLDSHHLWDLETSLWNRWPWWMNVYWCITSKIWSGMKPKDRDQNFHSG